MHTDAANLQAAYQAIAVGRFDEAAAAISAGLGRRDAGPGWQQCRIELLAREAHYHLALQHAEALLADWHTAHHQLSGGDGPMIPAGLIHTLGRLRLAVGQFQEGLACFDAVRAAGLFGDAPLKTNYPLWQGQDLNGRTLCLATEGGLGDILCFARFARHWQELGAKVVLATCAPVFPLIKSVPGVDFLIDRTASSEVYFDYWLPALSSPRLLRLDLNELKAQRYLSVPLAYQSKWKRLTQAPAQLKVGLCWQGRREFVEDYLRSIPASLVAPLLEIPGISWYKMQLFEGDNTLQHPVLIDRTADISGVTDLAALAEQMDVVISVDSGPAHLAAALGRETWLLNRQYGWITFATPQPPDEGEPHSGLRTASHWYESMRIYTQPRFGDWQTPLAAVASDLRQKLR